MVTGVERPHLLDQPIEVVAAVQQRLREVAFRPTGQPCRGVSPLGGAEQPVLRVLHADDHIGAALRTQPPPPRRTSVACGPVALVVQKYGGFSVAAAGHRKRLAERVVGAEKEGEGVILDVSRVGGTTRKSA